MHVVHRANRGKLVDVFRHVREQLGDIHAGLAALRELPWAAHEPRSLDLKGALENVIGNDFAVEFGQLRLRVEQVNLTGAALHAEMNYRIGGRGEVRLARAEVEMRSSRWGMMFGGGRPADAIAHEQPGQRGPMQAVLDAVEELAAVDGLFASVHCGEIKVRHRTVRLLQHLESFQAIRDRWSDIERNAVRPDSSPRSFGLLVRQFRVVWRRSNDLAYR